MSAQKMSGSGGNPRGGSSSSSQKPSSTTTYRKSRWESVDNNTSSSSLTNNNNNNNKPTVVTDPKSTTKTSSASNQHPPPSKPIEKPNVGGPSKPCQSDPIHPSPGSGKFHPPGAGPPFHLPEANGSPFAADPSGFGPPPPPAYGFHMLERRTIVLADGSVRSYFALPPDYQDFPHPGRPGDPPGRFLPFGPGGREPEPFPHEGFRGGREEMYGRGGESDYWNSLGLDGRGGPMPHPEGSLKRKYGEEDERDGRDELARQRQQLLQYGNQGMNPNGFPLGSGDRADYLGGGSSNPYGRGMDDLRNSKHMRVGGDYGGSHSRYGELGKEASLKHLDVDPQALKRAYFHFTRSLIDHPQKRNYLEDGKHGPLQCLACGRIFKEIQDMHGLVLHAYNSADVEHLGFHKALCVLMGWNYAKAPDNSKAYQSLSINEAAANKEDLIIWPPTVIIRNTTTGRGKDGSMEGMGNKVLDNKIRDLGFIGGKSKSLYDKDGHMGISLVKFAGDHSGLKEAIRLAEYFEKDNHGRRGWSRAQSSMSGRNDENNPILVKVDEKTREKTRILYGYLGTAFDLDELDFETRSKCLLDSRRDFKL